MRKFDLLLSVRLLPRDLRLLFANLFLFTFGLGLYNYVWSLYLRELHADAGQVGLVFSLGFIAAALSMIPGGILANKFELRWLLIISGVMGIPPPLIYYFAQGWADAIPGVILLQASSFAIPAFNAYIVGASDKKQVTAAFGITYSAAPLGIVFSPVIGSLLLSWVSIRELFLFAVVFLTLSTVVLFPMKKQPPLQKDRNHRTVETPRSLLEAVLLIFIVGVAFAFSLTNPFLPLYFQDFLGLNAGQILLLGAVQSLGGTLFYIFLGRRAEVHGHAGTMTLGVLLASSGLLGLALVRSSLFAIPMIFLFGGARTPSAIGYSLLSHVEGSRAGKFGFYLTMENLGLVAGSFIGGIFYKSNPIALLLSTSACLIAIGVMSLLGVKT